MTTHLGRNRQPLRAQYANPRDAFALFPGELQRKYIPRKIAESLLIVS